MIRRSLPQTFEWGGQNTRYAREWTLIKFLELKKLKQENQVKLVENSSPVLNQIKKKAKSKLRGNKEDKGTSKTGNRQEIESNRGAFQNKTGNIRRFVCFDNWSKGRFEMSRSRSHCNLDLRPWTTQNSDQFIFDSIRTFLPNLKGFSGGVFKITRSQGKRGICEVTAVTSSSLSPTVRVKQIWRKSLKVFSRYCPHKNRTEGQTI